MQGEGVTEKIGHKAARVILKGNTEREIPPDVEREHKTVLWAESLHKNAMLIAAAGVLASEDSLEKAASVLWWAGFAVPTGCLSEEEEDRVDLRDEEALRLWVEREAERIEGVLDTWFFYLAATGRLLDKTDAGEGTA